MIDEVLHVEDANEQEMETNRKTISSMRNKPLDSPPAQARSSSKVSSNEADRFEMLLDHREEEPSHE